jgi:hypothetical protein
MKLPAAPKQIQLKTVRRFISFNSLNGVKSFKASTVHLVRANFRRFNGLQLRLAISPLSIDT